MNLSFTFFAHLNWDHLIDTLISIVSQMKLSAFRAIDNSMHFPTCE